MNASRPRTGARRLLGLGLAACGALQADAAPAAAPKPVLLVIANQDFHYAEYAAVRASLEAQGLAVVVAAGNTRPAIPQDVGAGAVVRPQRALSDVGSAQHSAVVFVGGWGASSYQYAFSGTYADLAYRPNRFVAQEANRLISDFLADDKPVAGVCHGVTVLAWARVDGVSPLRDRVVVGPAGGAPGFRYAGHDYPDAEVPARSHIEMNGATMLTSASIGNPLSATDDVWVDGKVITAENYQAATRFAELLAQSIAAGRD